MFIAILGKQAYVACMDIELEWDEAKRLATLEQRQLDFADVAHIVWETALTVEDVRQDYSEVRYITLGMIFGRLHVCVWCYRGIAMRIISLRKANGREEKRYEQA